MSANYSQWTKYSLSPIFFVLSEGNEWLLNIYVITNKLFYKNGCLKSWEQHQSPKEQGEWFPEVLYESIDVSNNAQVFIYESISNFKWLNNYSLGIIWLRTTIHENKEGWEIQRGLWQLTDPQQEAGARFVWGRLHWTLAVQHKELSNEDLMEVGGPEKIKRAKTEKK